MSIPVKEFRAALKALNVVLGKKDSIKTLKRKKEDIIVDFRDAVLEAIENDTAEDLPVIVIDMYNDHMSDDDGGETEKSDSPNKKKTTTKKTTTKKTTTKKTTPKRSSKEEITKRNEMIKSMISENKHTKKEIVDVVSAKFTTVKPITIGTYIQDCMNEKYNKFPKLTVKNSKGILSFKK